MIITVFSIIVIVSIVSNVWPVTIIVIVDPGNIDLRFPTIWFDRWSLRCYRFPTFLPSFISLGPLRLTLFVVTLFLTLISLRRFVLRLIGVLRSLRLFTRWFSLGRPSTDLRLHGDSRSFVRCVFDRWPFVVVVVHSVIGDLLMLLLIGIYLYQIINDRNDNGVMILIMVICKLKWNGNVIVM